MNLALNAKKNMPNVNGLEVSTQKEFEVKNHVNIEVHREKIRPCERNSCAKLVSIHLEEVNWNMITKDR